MLGRRDFLRGIGLWLPAGAALLGGLLQACADSSDDSSDGDEGDPACSTDGDFNTKVGSNHGHTVDLTQAQVDAGAPVTLTLTAGNSHTHSLDLSADDLAAISAGDAVEVASSNNSGHSHAVTFNCVASSASDDNSPYLRVRYSVRDVHAA